MATDDYLLQCLGLAAELKAQDLFLKSGQVPRVRVGTDVFPIKAANVDEKHLEAILKKIILSMVC